MSRNSYSAWPEDYVSAAREFGDAIRGVLQDDEERKVRVRRVGLVFGCIGMAVAAGVWRRPAPTPEEGGDG